MVRFEGVFSVVPTPFLPDGEIDRESLHKTVELFIQAKVDGLTALGVTSETARLNEKERDVVLETILEAANHRVPVVAGTSSDSTWTCIELSKRALKAGAQAVMISPPRMAKLNSESIVQHYSSLANELDLPVVVQDYPPVSGYTMEPALLARIIQEVPAVRTIKLEDPPTPFKINQILKQCKGMDLKIFGGLGGTYLLEELMVGAAGAMTGFAYPEILVEIVRQFRAGNKEKAEDIFYRHVALMRFEFQEGIGMGIRKEILHRRGVFAHTKLRPPASRIDECTMKALEQLLGWLKREGSPWI